MGSDFPHLLSSQALRVALGVLGPGTAGTLAPPKPPPFSDPSQSLVEGLGCINQEMTSTHILPPPGCIPKAKNMRELAANIVITTIRTVSVLLFHWGEQT